MTKGKKAKMITDTNANAQLYIFMMISLDDYCFMIYA